MGQCSQAAGLALEIQCPELLEGQYDFLLDLLVSFRSFKGWLTVQIFLHVKAPACSHVSQSFGLMSSSKSSSVTVPILVAKGRRAKTKGWLSLRLLRCSSITSSRL